MDGARGVTRMMVILHCTEPHARGLLGTKLDASACCDKLISAAGCHGGNLPPRPFLWEVKPLARYTRELKPLAGKGK
jgi:hypothetical protein